MNNIMLSTVLLSILCSTTYADTTATSSAPAVSAEPVQANPSASTAKPTIAPAPGTPVPAATAPAVEPKPQAPAVIDCHYRIPAETTAIEDSVLSTWAKKASVQSFEFNPTSIDEELVALKSCYTDQGWQGFNDALQKSGNINAIKSQHLTVSSEVDGDIKITPLKDNQWKITVPMQVVYQNDKEKLTQQLSVDLLIGRKISGDLGIMQMIATPRQPAGTVAAQPAAAATTPNTAPAQQQPAAPVAAPAPGSAPATAVGKPPAGPTPAASGQPATITH